ncbi:hypothetical protein GCM10023170_075040 [Phytohabitans houttuyneae]|uniref:Uncharacterized protein n=1 Tax=Phytohabitans houttuyneae TaxID=1076126 RepID=A0A6V8KJJ1_9ACTN|nr:hypothetical protein Phou_077700 [Phytohabitans houttuyneae]
MAWGCAGAAAALVVTAACLTTPFGTVLLYVVLTGAWIYTALLLRHLRDTRLSPRTDAPGPREADRYENFSAMMSRTGRRR